MVSDLELVGVVVGAAVLVRSWTFMAENYWRCSESSKNFIEVMRTGVEIGFSLGTDCSGKEVESMFLGLEQEWKCGNSAGNGVVESK